MICRDHTHQCDFVVSVSVFFDLSTSMESVQNDPIPRISIASAMRMMATTTEKNIPIRQYETDPIAFQGK